MCFVASGLISTKCIKLFKNRGKPKLVQKGEKVPICTSYIKLNMAMKDQLLAF